MIDEVCKTCICVPCFSKRCVEQVAAWTLKDCLDELHTVCPGATIHGCRGYKKCPFTEQVGDTDREILCSECPYFPKCADDPQRPDYCPKQRKCRLCRDNSVCWHGHNGIIDECFKPKVEVSK